MADELGSRRALVNVVLGGEVDEVVVSFPEHKESLLDIKGRLNQLVEELEADYARWKDIPVQKDFALAIKRTRCPSALFAVRRGTVKNVMQFLRVAH